MEMEVETVTPCAFMWPSQYYKMPLSKIDGMVNLIFAWRAKERHLIFNACLQHCLAWCEIFAKNQIFAWQISPSIRGPPTLQNGILRNGQKKLKKLWLLWNGGETRISKDPKKSYEVLCTGISGGNPSSTARKFTSERRWAAARADTAPWRRPCVTTSWIHAGRAQTRSRKFGPAGSTDAAFSCSMTAERARIRKPYQLIRCGATQNKKIQ
jgi:hypothetical protein